MDLMTLLLKEASILNSLAHHLRYNLRYHVKFPVIIVKMDASLSPSPWSGTSPEADVWREGGREEGWAGQEGGLVVYCRLMFSTLSWGSGRDDKCEGS